MLGATPRYFIIELVQHNLRTINPRKIAIIGTGYVGTANAVGFAELGCDVVGFDTNAERIRLLRDGVPPYREDGLAGLLRRHLVRERLDFVADLSSAIRDAAFIIISVGTPSRDDGSADLSALELVIDQLSRLVTRRSTVIVLRSTVPAGTSDRMAERLPDGLELLYCPEFLREGSAVYDFLNPDRTIVGAESGHGGRRVRRAAERCRRAGDGGDPARRRARQGRLERLPGPEDQLCKRDCEPVRTDGRGCTRRCFGASDTTGESARRILTPGIGFGGPCFEKDVLSLEHVARHNGAPSQLLKATLRVNEIQPRKIVDMLEEELGALRGHAHRRMGPGV